MDKKRMGIALAALACAAALVAGTDIPLGVPGQWVWQRLVPGERGPLSAVFPVLAVLAALVLSGVWLTRLSDRRRLSLRFVPLLAALGSLIFSVMLISVGRMGRAEAEFAFLDRFTGGYLACASAIENPGDFFRSYADRMAMDADPANHLDVHPPGNTLISYLVLEWCRSSALPARLAAIGRNPSDRAQLREFARQGVFGPVRDEPALYDAASLLVLLSGCSIAAALFLILSAAETLLRGRLARHPAALIPAAALGAVAAPGAVLFAGNFDVIYYFLSALLFFLYTRSRCARHPAARTAYAAAAGAVAAFACSCSLAFGLMIPLLPVFLLGRRDCKSGIPPLLAFGLCGVLCAAAAYWFAGVDLLSCAWYAARNNGAFFAANRPESLIWLPWNAFDLIMFASPVVLTAAFGRFDGVRRPTFDMVIRFSLAVLVLFLMCSPFSRGEMGRLLLFIEPGLLLAACLSLIRFPPSSSFFFAVLLFAQGGWTILLRFWLKLCMVW